MLPNIPVNITQFPLRYTTYTTVYCISCFHFFVTSFGRFKLIVFYYNSLYSIRNDKYNLILVSNELSVYAIYLFMIFHLLSSYISLTAVLQSFVAQSGTNSATLECNE
jgi:hypothetical protein